MLHLQAGVDLQEVELAGVRVVDELDRAGRAVGDRLSQAHGGGMQSGALRVTQAGRGRLFDHLLVAALHRAVALTQCQHLALTIAKHLHLDVARTLDELLQEQTRVLEIGRG